MYVNVGRSLLETPYRLLVAVGMVKILAPGLSVWQLALLGPVVLCIISVLGRWHRDKGWARAEATVGVVDGLSPVSVVHIMWLHRLLERMRIPTTGIGAKPSDEVIAVLEHAARNGPQSS